MTKSDDYTMEIDIIRHNDKPSSPNDPHLSPLGQQRSKQFATWYTQNYGAPNFIFAAADSTASHRPVETVIPLSQATGVAIDSTIDNKSFQTLATELLSKAKFQNSRILVCWHHGELPDLLKALLAPSGSYPEPWNSQAFNLMVRLVFQNSKKPTVTIITEPF